MKGRDAFQLHDHSDITLEKVDEALKKAFVTCMDIVRTLDRDHVETSCEAVVR